MDYGLPLVERAFFESLLRRLDKRSYLPLQFVLLRFDKDVAFLHNATTIIEDCLTIDAGALLCSLTGGVFITVRLLQVDEGVCSY